MVRVATWNISWAVHDRAARLGALVAERGPVSLIFLQEANPAGLDRFSEAAGLDWWCSVDSAFPDLLAARGRVARRRSRAPRAAAIAGVGEGLRSPTPFPDVPLPEKVLAGWAPIDGTLATVASYHAPTGSHGLNKPAQAVQFARWLGSVRGPVVFGLDGNTPLVDPIDPSGVRTHWHTGDRHLDGHPGDDLLLGPEPLHPLRDALRVWLESHPDDMDRSRPEGPLRVSYKTRPDKPYRYDAIWITPDFGVDGIEYRYDEAIAAGTDHALVVADLSHDPSGGVTELAASLAATTDLDDLPNRARRLAAWLDVADVLDAAEPDRRLEGIDVVLRDAVRNPDDPFGSFVEASAPVTDLYARYRTDHLGLVTACLTGIIERSA